MSLRYTPFLQKYKGLSVVLVRISINIKIKLKFRYGPASSSSDTLWYEINDTMKHYKTFVFTGYNTKNSDGLDSA